MGFSSHDLIPAAIAALIGAVVGGIVAELRTLTQSARERRRALRILLYELLELRDKIRKSNPRDFLSALERFVAKKFGATDLAQFKASALQQIIRQTLTAALANDKATISSRYVKATEELAPYDPILAYRISGRAALLSVGDALKQYYEQIAKLPEISNAQGIDRFLGNAESTALDLVSKEALDDLSELIHMIASRLSAITAYRASKVIARQDSLSQEEFDQKLEHLMRGFVAQFGQPPSQSPS